jgi:hypothetical protein
VSVLELSHSVFACLLVQQAHEVKTEEAAHRHSTTECYCTIHPTASQVLMLLSTAGCAAQKALAT